MTARTSARVRSGLGYFSGLKAAGAKEAKASLLRTLGLAPLPTRPAPKKRIPRRVLRRCKGVRVARIGYDHPCGRKILITMVGGRPPVRCGECRVLKVYWQRFHRADPVAVILTLQSLARRGLIGREQYERLKETKKQNQKENS